MFLSLTGRAPLPFSRALRFDTAVAGTPTAPHTERRGAWQSPLRYGVGLRSPVHALLADAQGVWAWAPDDAHAAATRHASVQTWFEAHPGCDVRLWVAAQLTRSPDRPHAAAHDDEAALRSCARQEFIDRHGRVAAAWALATWKNDAARQSNLFRDCHFPELGATGKVRWLRVMASVHTIRRHAEDQIRCDQSRHCCGHHDPASTAIPL